MNPYLNTLLSATPTFGAVARLDRSRAARHNRAAQADVAAHVDAQAAIVVPPPDPLAPAPHYAIAMGASFLGWGIPAWLAVKWANEKGLTQKQVFQRWGAVGAALAAVKVYTFRRIDDTRKT
jgi:hypothetical protein